MPTRPPVRPALPGYAWDQRLGNGTGRFRAVNPNGSLGRIVSSREIGTELAAMHDRTAAQLASLARAAVAGDISPAVYQRTAMQVLKQTHTGAAAVAHGGWDRVPQAAWGRVGRNLRDEYSALARFTAELAAGNLDAEAAASRSALYTDAAYGRYWSERNVLARDRFSRERVVTVGDERVCQICRSAEALGWVAVDTFTIPLHLRCRCVKEYYGDEP